MRFKGNRSVLRVVDASHPVKGSRCMSLSLIRTVDAC